MKKKVFGRKLSRSRPAREALFATLTRSLILTGKIITTRAKAKAIIPDVEKMVTLAKKADVNARRKALSFLDNANDAVKALFGNVGPAFASRQSGFTRIISLPRRKGDNAQMVRLEWTDKVENKPEEKVVKAKIVKKDENISTKRKRS